MFVFWGSADLHWGSKGTAFISLISVTLYFGPSRYPGDGPGPGVRPAGVDANPSAGPASEVGLFKMGTSSSVGTG